MYTKRQNFEVPDPNTANPEVSADDISSIVTLEGLTGFINAGGRGTRLYSIFSHGDRGVCKALIPFGHPPITLIEHQINKLIHAGIPTIVAEVGDHIEAARHVEEVYGGRSDVLAVRYPNTLESGGGLLRTVKGSPELFADDVYVCNVDTILDVDEADLLAFHRAKGGYLTIALTTAKGKPNEGAYYVGTNDRVVYSAETSWHHIPECEAAAKSTHRASSTGAVIVSVGYLKSIDWRPEDGPLSLYRDRAIIAEAIGQGNVFAYNNGERLFTDLGTVESWNSAQENYATIAPYIHYN